MRKSAISALALILTLVIGGCAKPGPAAVPTPTPTPAPAPAKTIELRFAHSWPPMHELHAQVFLPWSNELEKRTNGRYKFQIYPSGMLGANTETYDIAVKGTTDISVVTQSQIPGRFPLEEAFHLPYLIQGPMGDPTSDKIRHVIYDKYLIPLELKDVKVLWTGRYGPNVLHMVKKPVRSVEDMKGSVIGFPGGRILPMLLDRLGASAEMVFFPDMYTALQRGTIDGMLIPMEATLAAKLQEVEKYNTNLNLASGSFCVVMNTKTWESLPPDVQQIMDELDVWAEARAAKAMADSTLGNYLVTKRDGVEMIELAPEEMARLIEISRPVELQWVQELEAKGLPARALYEDIKKMTGE
jgi:TRAP-type C4-dicarboxylate transport system substrate-binding protein